MVRAKKENKARGGLRGCDLQRTVSVKADSGVKTRGIVGVGPVDVGGSFSRQKQVWLQEETSYVRGQGGRSGASPKAGHAGPYKGTLKTSAFTRAGVSGGHRAKKPRSDSRSSWVITSPCVVSSSPVP